MKERSEAEIDAIVNSHAVGTKSGWHYLLTVAQRKASRYLLEVDAQDIAQESALALYKTLKAGKEINSLAGFISCTARFKSLDFLKKKDPLKYKAFELDDQGEEKDLLSTIPGSGVPFGGDSEKALAILADCLKRIDPPCPDILKKRHMEDTPHKEVADALKIPPGQIRMKTGRCLDKLRKAVKKDCPSFFNELAEFAS